MPARSPETALQHGPADLLGDARVDGRLEDHDGARPRGLTDRLRRADDRRQVRPVVLVHGCRHRDHEERRPGEVRRVGREMQGGRPQLLRIELARPVVATAQLLHLALVDVEADRPRELPRERQRDRKPDVPKPDDRDPFHHCPHEPLPASHVTLGEPRKCCADLSVPVACQRRPAPERVLGGALSEEVSPGAPRDGHPSLVAPVTHSHRASVMHDHTSGTVPAGPSDRLRAMELADHPDGHARVADVP